MRKKPPVFSIDGNNCSTRACDLLHAAGIVKEKHMPGLDTPNNLNEILASRYGGRCYFGYTEVDRGGHAKVEEIGSEDWNKRAAHDNFLRIDAMFGWDRE